MTPDERELRERCLDLARANAPIGAPAKLIVETAQTFLDFVKGEGASPGADNVR